jgi:hypothetical protein
MTTADHFSEAMNEIMSTPARRPGRATLLVLGAVAALVAGIAGIASCGASPAAQPVPVAAEASPSPSAADPAADGCQQAEGALAPGYQPNRVSLDAIGATAAGSSLPAVADAGRKLSVSAQQAEGVTILGAVATLVQVCRAAGFSGP